MALPAPFAVASAVTGCGGVTSANSGGGGGGYTPPLGSFVGLDFSGTVLAWMQPVGGATVQIHAAGTAGNGSAPTQLLAAARSTDTSGAFHVAAGAYTCPAENSILYVVATGGMLTGGAVNAARNLVTVPGPCNSLGSGAAFVLNELSTAATAYALRPFLSVAGQLGSSPTNLQGLMLGAATLARLANLATGTAPGTGFAGNGIPPVAKLNAVANVSVLAGETATVPGAPLSGNAGWGSELGMTEPFGIALDAAGDVWVSSYGDNRLIEFVGAAMPVKTPLLGGVRVP